MLSRRALLISATALLPLPLAAPAFAQSDGPIQVVATFSILGDMVKRIGGEHIAVKTLVGPDGDAHVYQPTPADARTVSEAEILVVNGLEFEGWLDRLVDATDFDGMRVVATAGINPISFDDDHDEHDDEHDMHEEHDEHDEHEEHEEHAEHDEHDEHEEDEEHAEHDEHDEHEEDEEHAEAGHDDHHHGAFDPHAWQSFANAVVYVDNITAALSQASPANAADFYQNRAAYVAEIEALDAEIHELMEGLPADHRTVVTSHDAFQYFARYYGLTFVAPQGLSTESEASAKDVAHLIEQIREQGISAVFVENIGDSRLLERIADETGAGIGGTLYPDALSGPDGPAGTYLDMMRHNATTIAQALNP